MSDYAFMKAGFNNVKGKDDDDEELEKNTISIILSYTEGAIITASKYVLHSKRHSITPEDIKRGMMMEMFFFNKRDDSLERALKIKEEMLEDDSMEDEEDISCDADEEEFCESECKCALCKCINNIYTRWDKWSLGPKTPFEAVFKKHIENMN